MTKEQAHRYIHTAAKVLPKIIEPPEMAKYHVRLYLEERYGKEVSDAVVSALRS